MVAMDLKGITGIAKDNTPRYLWQCKACKNVALTDKWDTAPKCNNPIHWPPGPHEPRRKAGF
jgi:hypothetical protein